MRDVLENLKIEVEQVEHIFGERRCPVVRRLHLLTIRLIHPLFAVLQRFADAGFHQFTLMLRTHLFEQIRSEALIIEAEHKRRTESRRQIHILRIVIGIDDGCLAALAGTRTHPLAFEKRLQRQIDVMQVCRALSTGLVVPFPIVLIVRLAVVTMLYMHHVGIKVDTDV